MADSDDLLKRVLEATAAPGAASLDDLHVALGAIAQELRTANLIAAKAVLTSGSVENEAPYEQDICNRLGRPLPKPGDAYFR